MATIDKALWIECETDGKIAFLFSVAVIIVVVEKEEHFHISVIKRARKNLKLLSCQQLPRISSV
jgi:hypothetical protein